MTKLLIKLFIPNSEYTTDEHVRTSYGVLSGCVGIVLNVVLAVLKMACGLFTRSISIVADGVNNLFDSLSSIISLAGFKISGKPADDEHPFGHGRAEYVSALTLAFVVLVTGIELVKSSVDKLMNPEAVVFSLSAAIVLVFAIFSKLWLAVFNTKIGKKINSITVKAVVKDSIGDIAATSSTLIALISSKFTDAPVDAVMGIVVALFIIYTGISIIKDTLGPLLGEPPDNAIVDEIGTKVLSYDGVIAIHDLVLHAYGHSKIIGSLHVEVPATTDVMVSHDTIDLIERDIKSSLGIDITIHMDPILVDDEHTDTLKGVVLEIVNTIDERITLHDFRVVDGPTHTNMIFDLVIPHKFPMTENELLITLNEKIKEKDESYFAVVTIDRGYTSAQ